MRINISEVLKYNNKTLKIIPKHKEPRMGLMCSHLKVPVRTDCNHAREAQLRDKSDLKVKSVKPIIMILQF